MNESNRGNSFDREPKQEYVDEFFDTLPPIEAGVDIPRAVVTRLNGGKDAEVHLSIGETLEQHGWSVDAITKAQPGDTVFNVDTSYTVKKGSRGRINLIDNESGIETYILAKPESFKAHEYRYQLGDKEKTKKISVFDAAYKNRSIETVDFLGDLVAAIPIECIDTFDEIRIFPMKTDKSGKFKENASAVFTDKTVITLYVDPEKYQSLGVIETLYHELGHAIAKKLKGSVNPGEKWKKVMRMDGNQVSEYAEKTKYKKLGDDGEVEDFAETAKLYFATDGAKRGKAEQLRGMISSRFEKFDAIMADLRERRKSGLAGTIKRAVTRSGGSLDK